MIPAPLIATTFITLLAGLQPAAWAADPVRYRDLMTEAERAANHEAMRNLDSEAAREAFRAAKHAELRERARERGLEVVEPCHGGGHRKGGHGHGHGKGRGHCGNAGD